jgi:hypothetical protein
MEAQDAAEKEAKKQEKKEKAQNPPITLDQADDIAAGGDGGDEPPKPPKKKTQEPDDEDGKSNKTLRDFKKSISGSEKPDTMDKEVDEEVSSVDPELLSNIDRLLSDLRGTADQMSADGDELGAELQGSIDNGMHQIDQVVKKIQDRDEKGVGDEDELYKVITSGGLGSDRGRYVEQGLTDHVFPEIYGHQEGLEFHNDGGPRVKTDVRSTLNGKDLDRFTVKSTVGTDGLEANNAGFRRFFEMWGLDPNEGPGMMFSRLMGIPYDFAEENGFGDGMGEWNDKRDGLSRPGSKLNRKLPIQNLYPDVNFSDEELNANSMLPSTFKELHPKEFDEGMKWLEDNKLEIVRRIMSQRDNDFGEGGSEDPNARPNVDYDPEPVNRTAWYHLNKGSKSSPKLRGNLVVHDISEEVLKPIVEQAQWELSDSISGGFKLNAKNPKKESGRGSVISLLNLSRKANKAGGGRYGNGFHSPRFGYNHNAFDLYPEVFSSEVEMDMGAKQEVPVTTAKGKPAKKRDGSLKTKVVDGKIIPNSVKVGKTNWGTGYKP